MTSADGPEYLVKLTGCQHSPTFRRPYLPELGTKVWCVPCAEYRPVEHVIGQYMNDCEDCRYRAYFGSARMLAARRARAHVQRFPRHTVSVSLGLTLHTVIRGHDAQDHAVQESLFDTPPF